MNVPPVMVIQHLDMKNEQLQEEIEHLEIEMKHLGRSLLEEKKDLDFRTDKLYHGSMDLSGFLQMDISENPFLEKKELDKMIKEYNETELIFRKIRKEKYLGRNIDQMKKGFDS